MSDEKDWADMDRQMQTELNNDIRVLIVVGPGEEEDAAEAYADLDDSISGWYDKADWVRDEL